MAKKSRVVSRWKLTQGKGDKDRTTNLKAYWEADYWKKDNKNETKHTS